MTTQDYLDDLRSGQDALKVTWVAERHDNEDGSIVYEVWTSNCLHMICKIVDSYNVFAKRDAEYIVELHNKLIRDNT